MSTPYSRYPPSGLDAGEKPQWPYFASFRPCSIWPRTYTECCRAQDFLPHLVSGTNMSGMSSSNMSPPHVGMNFSPR